MASRIYKTKVEIDTEKTKALYNKRAQNIKNMNNIYTSVLLGDQKPEYAKLWNASEKEMITPFLDADKNSVVLDLGCGIGRWAESLLPVCREYIGLDFSSEMIGYASERMSACTNDKKKFICGSVQDFLRNVPVGFIPDIIICSYVCMYINDSEIEECFRRISDIAGEKCVIYFIDTVALNERLTLDEIYSDALRSDYSALYRTVKEYDELFGVFEEKGFKKVSFGFMEKLNDEPQFSETDRHYTILKRR